MVKKIRRVSDIRRNMPKAVLFFIFCVLLSEVSPKVPVRKEDLLNKKAALAKQLNPTVPKWEDLASKLHTKDKPNQNKSKTLVNMLKVVSAKEIDIPAADDVKNSTIDNATLNTNNTNNQNVINNSVKSKPVYNNPFIAFKPQKHNNNATVAKTTKKYAANETIGGKLAYFLMKHAINTTKETPNTPELIAPTMIPIFKPMPISTRNTIPQPLANELIRKDNYAPKELNQQLLENLDDVELNINIFNPMQNKAVLNPLQATEDKLKENIPKDPHLKVFHSQNAMNQFSPQNSLAGNEKEHNFIPAIHNPLQDGQMTHILNENKAPESIHLIHPNDIMLNYVDARTNNHPGDTNPHNKLTNIDNPIHNIADNNQAAHKTELAQGNTENNGVNQVNFENIHPGMLHPAQLIGKHYELSISPPLQRNPTQARNIELNPEFVLEKLNPDFLNVQYSPNQHEVLAQQNSFVNQNPKDFPNPSMFTNQNNNIIRNDIGINQDISNGFPVHNNGVNNHPQQFVNDDFAAKQNIITQAQYAVHPSQINSGVIPSSEQNQGHGNTNLSPKNTGFSLPCLKASDVLEDLTSTAPCCQNQKGNAKLNSVTENPMSSLQCEKPILDVKDEDESVAIVFKPKNISLLKFYGDLLKKITLTVLVPYHITKLSPENVTNN